MLVVVAEIIGKANRYAFKVMKFSKLYLSLQFFKFLKLIDDLCKVVDSTIQAKELHI